MPGWSQQWNGSSGNYNLDSNWTPNPPGTPGSGQTATFGSSGANNITFSQNNTSIGTWDFTDPVTVQNYTFTLGRNRTLTFDGDGITGEGDKATLTNNRGTLNFTGTGSIRSTAGTATINNQRGTINFRVESNAGDATITIERGTLNFRDDSSAADATIQNNRNLRFRNDSSAGGSNITNTRSLQFLNASGAGDGDAKITNTSTGDMRFRNTSSAEEASIENAGSLSFRNASRAG
ncbi:MAG: hypothetical protein AAF967_13160, partial [Pseudomonadota bacterium]